MTIRSTGIRPIERNGLRGFGLQRQFALLRLERADFSQMCCALAFEGLQLRLLAEEFFGLRLHRGVRDEVVSAQRLEPRLLLLRELQALLLGRGLGVDLRQFAPHVGECKRIGRDFR